MERINKLKKLKQYVTFFEVGGWMGSHVYVTAGWLLCMLSFGLVSGSPMIKGLFPK